MDNLAGVALGKSVGRIFLGPLNHQRVAKHALEGMAMRFGLPQVLVLVASVVAVIGVRRLSRPSTDAGITTRQALLVWLLLLTGGLSVWLLAASGHL